MLISSLCNYFCGWKSVHNKIQKPSNHYPFILIKGKYSGYGGKIKETWNSKQNLLNSAEGFTVGTVVNDTTVVLEVRERDTNLEHPKSKENSLSISELRTSLPNPAISVPPSLQFLDIIDSAKESYIIGEGGSIFQQKIDYPVNLKGENFIYLVCPTLDTVVTTAQNSVQQAFAKILLTSSVGKYIYNTFVSSPKKAQGRQCFTIMEGLKISI